MGIHRPGSAILWVTMRCERRDEEDRLSELGVDMQRMLAALLKGLLLKTTEVYRSLYNRTIWILTIVLTMAIGFAVAAQDLPGEGVTVKMGKASWLSTEPKVAVTTLLLEELGYNVEPAILFSSNPVGYLAINQGDVDFWPSGWFPGHSVQLPGDWDRNASIVGMICEGCGAEGYLVNIPAIEEFGIETLEDFKRPEVKAAFDANGDGRADLFGCPPGWGCHEIIEHHMDAYDLRDHVNHVTADYTLNFADALARIQAGEPTLYYTWAPNNTILLAVPGEDVMWIGVPYIDRAPAHEAFEDEDLIASVDHAVLDPLPMGFVPNDIQFAANNRFLEANPAAKALLENVELDLTWLSEATLRIEDGEDVFDIAAEWIEANRDTVDAWLDAALAAAQ